MSDAIEPTDEMRAEWREWIDDPERTPEVRAIAERFEPWRWYRLTTTGQMCRLLAIGEDGTVRIYAMHPVLGEISAVQVFGINPDDLVPWGN